MLPWQPPIPPPTLPFSGTKRGMLGNLVSPARFFCSSDRFSCPLLGFFFFLLFFGSQSFRGSWSHNPECCVVPLRCIRADRSRRTVWRSWMAAPLCRLIFLVPRYSELTTDQLDPLSAVVAFAAPESIWSNMSYVFLSSHTE